MVEYWNVEDPVFSGVGLTKEVTHFNASLARPARHRSRSGEAGGGILPIPRPVHYKLTLSSIFPEPIIPLFQRSIMPIVSEAN